MSHEIVRRSQRGVPARRQAGQTRLAMNLARLGGLATIFALAYYLAFWLRFEGRLAGDAGHRLIDTVAWVVLLKLGCFVAFRAHGGWLRSTSFYDLLTLAKAAAAGLFALAVVNWCVLPSPRVPRSVCLLDWGATLVLLGAVGAALRTWREHVRLPGSLRPKRVLILAAEESGALLLRAARRTGRGQCEVVGFLTSDTNLVGGRIEGVRVLGVHADACALAKRHGAEEIFVVQGELSGEQLRTLMDEAAERAIEVRVLPSFARLLDGSVTFQPRSVSIEDLLCRDPVELDLETIRNWIDGRVLLVTGSAGSIGSEICRQLLRFSPAKLVLVDRSENGQFFLERELRTLAPAAEIEVCIADVLDARRMRAIFRRYAPSVVFHAAAYKHVPLMEAHPGEAVSNIVLATANVADLAVECGADTFVMISTDKAVCPTSVMGACKRVAELYVQSLSEASATRCVTVRFGNVLDSNGSVVQIFRQQILDGGPVTVTHPDMERFFMTIPEAAQLVIQAGAIGEGGQILTLDMGKTVRVLNLARDMIRLSGYRPEVDIPIEFIGLRPGEKMIEELLGEDERRLPTSHPKVMVAAGRPCDPRQISEEVETLAQLIYGPPQRIIAQLRKIIPEFGAELSSPQELRRAA